MDAIREWFRRLWYLVNRRRFDEALRREMESHRSMMSDPARFGSILRLREDSADVWGWRWLQQLGQDARFGARMLYRNRGFAATAILTLALATGATTAIFSIVNSVLLRPLPFADPDRLVQVYGRTWSEDRGDGTSDPMRGPVGSLELDEYTKQSTLVEGFAGYARSTRHLSGTQPERLLAVETELTFFTLLGVDPIVGRTFGPGDPQDVAVISAPLWQRRFDSDRSVSGKTLVLDGRPFTVIGVMPATFQFPFSAGSMMPGALPESRTDLWIPLEPRASGSGALRRGRVDVLARLRPDVALDRASAELNVIAKRVETQHPEIRRRVAVRLAPLAEDVVRGISRSLWILFAAVGLVLAAACANVANLLLARMMVRTREVVTRASLGASRLRLVRQFLAESLLLSLAGGVLGLLIARWSTKLLVGIASAKIPRAHEIAFDWTAFGFLLLACVMTAVLFGLAPALAAARMDVHQVTKESAGHATMGRNYARTRDALVVIEVALAFVLAVGAALVVREVIRLQNVKSGMVTENVLTLHLTPRAPAGDYYAIEQRVAGLAGVQAAGFTQMVPLQNWGWEAIFAIRGRPFDNRSTAGLRYVTPGYFRALGIPVLRGRAFTERDSADAPHVIVINDALARRYFRDDDPIGRELISRGTIVGVVGDVRQAGLDRPAEPELFYPAAQNVTMAPDTGMTLIVRTATPPEPLIEALRSAVRDVNPTLAIFNIRTMTQVVSDSLWELNLYRWLISLFAALTLTLAAIGLYGVMSYSVTSRMREFAVRLAVGSEPVQLTWLVLGSGARLASAGLGVGVLAALALTPSLRTLSVAFGGDATTYAAMAVLLLAVALAACIVPAIRVAGVNPASALRHD